MVCNLEKPFTFDTDYFHCQKYLEYGNCDRIDIRLQKIVFDCCYQINEEV